MDMLIQEIMKNSKSSQGTIDIIEADLNDRASLIRMTSSTRVIMSTAGPFAIIGTPIVDACCRSGTSYVDITGEPQWIRTLIDGYHDIAKEKKIKIVPCCGFDCIPVDMGCKVIVDSMIKRGLSPMEARSVLTKMKGGGSGGTFASVFNIFDSCSLAELVRTMNPFYLSPCDAFNKLDQPASTRVRFAAGDRFLPFFDRVAQSWCMPFVMQSIDTRVVNRSNAISGWRYGRNFIYSEGMAVPMIAAFASALITPLVGVLLLFSFTRNILKSMVPQPGEGPSEHERETGHFHFKLWGRGVGADGKEVTIKGRIDAPDGDAGYKQTAVMVCEAAVCLAMDSDRSPKQYGLLTPSTALGDALLTRLDAANIKISVDN